MFASPLVNSTATLAPRERMPRVSSDLQDSGVGRSLKLASAVANAFMVTTVLSVMVAAIAGVASPRELAASVTAERAARDEDYSAFDDDSGDDDDAMRDSD